MFKHLTNNQYKEIFKKMIKERLVYDNDSISLDYHHYFKFCQYVHLGNGGITDTKKLERILQVIDENNQCTVSTLWRKLLIIHLFLISEPLNYSQPQSREKVQVKLQTIMKQAHHLIAVQTKPKQTFNNVIQKVARSLSLSSKPPPPKKIGKQINDKQYIIKQMVIPYCSYLLKLSQQLKLYQCCKSDNIDHAMHVQWRVLNLLNNFKTFLNSALKIMVLYKKKFQPFVIFLSFLVFNDISTLYPSLKKKNLQRTEAIRKQFGNNPSNYSRSQIRTICESTNFIETKQFLNDIGKLDQEIINYAGSKSIYPNIGKHFSIRLVHSESQSFDFIYHFDRKYQKQHQRNRSVSVTEKSYFKSDKKINQTWKLPYKIK